MNSFVTSKDYSVGDEIKIKDLNIITCVSVWYSDKLLRTDGEEFITYLKAKKRSKTLLDSNTGRRILPIGLCNVEYKGSRVSLLYDKIKPYTGYVYYDDDLSLPTQFYTGTLVNEDSSNRYYELTQVDGFIVQRIEEDVEYTTFNTDIEKFQDMPPVTQVFEPLQEGKGVVYYMKDEHNNECEFDFKNIQKVGTDIREPRAYYFGVTDGSDDSLHGSSHDNHILTENINGVKYIPTDIYTNRKNVVRYLEGGNPVDNSSEGSSVHTSLEPNKLYDFGEKTEIVITEFLQGKSGVTCEYMFQFMSGDTATSLTVPITVRWMNEPSIQPNKIYQVSIENNLGIIGEWDNE